MHVSQDEEEGYVSYAESMGDDVPAKKRHAGADTAVTLKTNNRT